MKNMITLLALALVVSLATNNVVAIEGVGAGSSFQFGVDARALGMGAGFVALADGFSAPYWNPAGMALTASTDIGGMYTNKFSEGLNFDYLGAVTNLAGFRVGGAFLDSSISGIETFDSHGNPGATISDNEMLFAGSAAVPLALGAIPIAVGGTVKYYTHSVAGEKGSGFGGDIGAVVNYQFSPITALNLGATVSDIGGTQIKWTTGAIDTVSTTTRVGLALWSFNSAVIGAGQLDLETGAVHLGLEFSPLRLIPEIPASVRFSIRLGTMKPVAGGWSNAYGVGFGFLGMRADVAYIFNKLLGNSLILSGGAQF